MATTRPFAYNIGSPISGTTQVGSLAIGDASVEYSSNYGGLQWWMGADEDPEYIIAQPVPAGNVNTPIPGLSAYVQFFGSVVKTDQGFLNMVNALPSRVGQIPFTNTQDAYNWLGSNDYWTSFTNPSVSPTPTPSMTPTLTPTNTTTPTPTTTATPTATPVPKFTVINNSTGNRTITNITGGGPWSLTTGTYPVGVGQTAYGLTHPALTLLGLDQLVILFGGSDPIDISITKNGSPYTASTSVPTTNITASQINYFVDNPSDTIQTTDVIVITIIDTI